MWFINPGKVLRKESQHVVVWRLGALRSGRSTAGEGCGLCREVGQEKKRELCPVKAVGKKMCNSFWGQAWCENLERYSDFSNRLPRGRTYARNGSVVDLQIERGKVKALVGGSDVYRISIAIKTLSRPAWKRIKQDCSQSIDSLLDLLQGRFDQGVMQRLTHPEDGLFPQPTEIEMECSCPDWAGLCKHLAAVMYCIGARLDAAPELLFTLRDVDHLDLIGQAVAAENLESALTADKAVRWPEAISAKCSGSNLIRRCFPGQGRFGQPSLPDGSDRPRPRRCRRRQKVRIQRRRHRHTAGADQSARQADCEGETAPPA